MFRCGHIGDIILKKIKGIIITDFKIRFIPRSVAESYYKYRLIPGGF